MSSDNDKCFQCQETGHLACYCTHIRCFDCDKYGHVAMQTVLIKYHLQAHQHTVEVIPPVGMIDPHLGIIATTGIPTMIIKTGRGPVIPDLTHTILDTGVPAAMTTTGVTPDCFIDLHVVAPHNTGSSSSYCYCRDTPHCRSSSHRNLSRDDSRSRPHKSHRQHYKPAQGSSSNSQTMPWKNKDRRHKQVTIDNPSSEYYSSDDQDSDSEDDLN